MRRLGFPRRLRIRRRPEFLKVQRTGQKIQMRHFLVFVAARGSLAAPRPPKPAPVAESKPVLSSTALLPTRLGVTVTKKVGGAVKRNRIKRLVREAFRHERSTFVHGFDMVWVAKRNATETTFEQVVSDMHVLARRLRRRSPSGDRSARGPL